MNRSPHWKHQLHRVERKRPGSANKSLYIKNKAKNKHLAAAKNDSIMCVAAKTLIQSPTALGDAASRTRGGMRPLLPWQDVYRMRAQIEVPHVERTTNKLELLKDVDQNADDIRDHALDSRMVWRSVLEAVEGPTENVEKTPVCVKGNENWGCGGKVWDQCGAPELELVDEMR